MKVWPAIIRSARHPHRLGKALEASKFGGDLPAIKPEQMPRIFRGAYGIGSRDFRPEHTLGAYEFATGQTVRKDGKSAADGTTYFVLGVDHPYAVISKDRRRCLPDKAIAVRFHSIGGWGMITTGKNLGMIIGDFGNLLWEQAPITDDYGRPLPKLYVMANPKYGSEKERRAHQLLSRRRAASDSRELRIESRGCRSLLRSKSVHAHQSARRLEQRRLSRLGIQRNARSRLERIPRSIANSFATITFAFSFCRASKLRAKRPIAPNCNCACRATHSSARFSASRRSSKTTTSPRRRSTTVVEKQYQKKFGRFGDAVVASNMNVMMNGFSRVQEVQIRRSSMPRIVPACAIRRCVPSTRRR
jgi:pyruvate-ferredoxin/flavodoxin oxidoreductase